MNGAARILAASEGRPADRRAVAPLLALYGARLIDCDLRSYYSDDRLYARGQEEVSTAFGPDVLFGPFALALEAAAFGCEIRFFDNQPPNLWRSVLDSAAAIDDLVVPSVDRHPGLGFIRGALRRMADRHSGETAIAAIAAGCCNLPSLILGIDAWMDTLLFDTSAARRMLDLCSIFSAEWINALFADGATFVVVPSGFADPHLVSRPVAEELTIPALRCMLRNVAGPVLLHSMSLPLVKSLDLLADLPNVIGFVLDSGEDFAKARSRAGDEALLAGNISGPMLTAWSEEEISAACTALLIERHDDPRFVLGTSNADIPMDTDPAKIRVLCEAPELFAARKGG